MSNASEDTIETWPQTGLGIESQDNKPLKTVKASGGVDALENGEIYVSWDGPEDPANPGNCFGLGVTGLTYLGLGVGCSIGMIGFGLASDRIMKSMTAKGKPNKPEYRLITMIPGAVLLPIGLLWYEWTAEKGVFWLVPIIGTGIAGCGIITIWISIQVYLVDAFTMYAVSAVAANTIIRSVFGAFLPLAGQPLYNALGLGWGNTLLAFIALAMIPIPWVFLRQRN
ncbi:MFS transporter [Lachnellula hyalina]|uniref:MFS transporter n=1 Tax=Lachnellula hyalina TaxID=1316788 RepID=A0A8H8QVE0_9HELO|nr:MFS transporter [Lachnellula hyalina]TVY23444.1 MFS transporter [Lachnellula hyalina]